MPLTNNNRWLVIILDCSLLFLVIRSNEKDQDRQWILVYTPPCPPPPPIESGSRPTFDSSPQHLNPPISGKKIMPSNSMISGIGNNWLLQKHPLPGFSLSETNAPQNTTFTEKMGTRMRPLYAFEWRGGGGGGLDTINLRLLGTNYCWVVLTVSMPTCS